MVNTRHEFQVLAKTGEDRLAISDSSDYAANIERADSLWVDPPRPAPKAALACIATPGANSIAAVCRCLKVSSDKSIKAILVKGVSHPVVALFVRGDDSLNPIKAAKQPLVASPLVMAEEIDIVREIGCPPGFIGPKDLTVPILADQTLKPLSDFVCGANRSDKHYINVNWKRDLPEPEFVDLRQVKAGDLSPDGQGKLRIIRGIEVGQVFMLGKRYSEPMKAVVLDENNQQQALYMGSYGIGISRIVAASIEQNHDEAGIIWPTPLAPFDIIIVPINLHQSNQVRTQTEALYQQLQQQGFEVLLDDRKERPGVLFADADLLGIPHRLVISEKNLSQGKIEYKARDSSQSQIMDQTTLFSFLQPSIK